MIELTKQSFQAQVLDSAGPVLVDFSAPWCGFCRRIAPVLERLAQKYPELTFAQANVDEMPDEEARYQIEIIPTLILFQHGKPGVALVNPPTQAQIEQWLAAQLEAQADA